MSNRLSMNEKIVHKDLDSLERYSNGIIEFDQLKFELEQHNKVTLSDERVRELLRNTGFDRKER